MLVEIVLFIAILAYSMIVSQSFMYFIALGETQKSMGAASYIELRKLLDQNFRKRFAPVVYTALLSNLVLVILAAREPRSVLFTTAALAFLGLLIDTMITVKGNLPINDLINKWTINNYPEDWSKVRDQWLNIFHWRQVANVGGFLFLLAGVVFG